MKKVVMIAVLTLAVGVSGSALAGFGSKLGGSVGDAANKAVKKAGKSTVEKQMNKEISKKTSSCKFKSGTTETTCNLTSVVSGLNAAKQILESSGLSNDVDIHVEAYGPNSSIANSRANAVRDNLRQQVNYWDYYVNGNGSGGDKLRVWVKVN